MTQPRRGLGRGLDALLPGGGEEAPAGRTLQEIDIDLIAPNPEQPRTNFHRAAARAGGIESASTASSSRWW